MKRQNARLLFALVTLVALVLTACGAPAASGGGSDSTQPPAAAPTENVAQGQPQSADSAAPAVTTISKNILLDPANATDADSLSVIAYVYEGLFKVQGDSVTPMLAESYTVSDDGLDYIIHLRPNVTFQDGSPVNADAVIANFNRWFDPNDPAHGSGQYTTWVSFFGGFKGETVEGGKPKSTFDGIEKVDELTVIIHLNTPDGQFIAKLNNPAFDIVSPAAFGADYFGTSLGTASGTGPYKISSWSDTGLTLEPFSGYWGTPATGTLNFQFK